MRSLCALVLLLALSSCVQKSNLNEQLDRMISKEIVFGNSYHKSNEEFVVVHYVDSIGCIPCKLRPHDWVAFQSRIDSLYDNEVRIVFVSHMNAIKDLKKLMVAREMRNIDVLPDSANRWRDENQIGDNQLFYTMLLDANNKVLVVGAPFLNDKMMSLYDNAILKGR